MKMRKSKLGSSLNYHPIYSDYREIAHYWMLTILVKLGVHKKILNEHICSEEDVMLELGITEGIDNPDEWNCANTRRTLFEKYHSHSERPVFPTHTTIARNIAKLGTALGLNQIEQDLLHFRIIASRHMELRICLDQLSSTMDLMGTVHTLTMLLDCDESSLEKALRLSSQLSRTGILRIGIVGLCGLMQKLELLSGLADNLQLEHEAESGLFDRNFITSAPARLAASDYPHLSKDIAILDSYLKDAATHGSRGVNVLIHGTPGSGKTEFVKMLAQRMGRTLYEIASALPDGEPILRSARFRSFLMSQQILSMHPDKPLILFDEIEDVFSNRKDEGDESDKFANAGGMKAWVNRILEDNPVPAFWLTNNIQSIDPAYRRRFDYIIELNAPPRSVRRQVINRYLGDLPVSEQWRASLAENEFLNPAVMERAAKVIKRVRETQPAVSLEDALQRTLENSMEALGLPRPLKRANAGLTTYRLDILNTDVNLAEICNGLRQTGTGRICLYGPPGTGKSALGRHIAEALDRPLLVRRASDILSPWVGMTEQKMASMFREAEYENAVLLLDEADSFLRERANASKSWEVTEVNEMLTQMEAFSGIFIASTNLMDAIDTAALRRFDLKIRLNYLNADQAWRMFEDLAVKLGFEVDDSLRQSIAELHNLTPGDFENVARQNRIQKTSSILALFNLIQHEVRGRLSGNHRRIGF